MNGRFYFKDENGKDIGPYETLIEADKAREKYAKELLEQEEQE